MKHKIKFTYDNHCPPFTNYRHIELYQNMSMTYSIVSFSTINNLFLFKTNDSNIFNYRFSNYKIELNQLSYIKYNCIKKQYGRAQLISNILDITNFKNKVKIY